MIKINLVREGRAVRGAGAPAAAAVSASGPSAANLNNIIIVAVLVAGLLAALGYWFWQKRQLGQREEIVAQRTIEAQKLEPIIREVEQYQKQKDSLQQRIDLINALKQNQKGPVRILDQISRDLPDLVWLDTMEIRGGSVTLTGRGLNPNAIALFIENIKNNTYFEEPQVGSVTQTSASPVVYTFDMNFAFTYVPKAETTGTEAAAPAAPAAVQ
ncbi:MAG TPA: PilN domain-containing protein [Thermoanaerobaculia bacterium]